MIGLISDVHGNAPALEAVLDSLDGMGVEQIVCLGDVAGYYSEVNACCAMLRARQVPTIMGNHDWYLGSGASCERSRSANDCLDYQRRVIEPDHLEWLRRLPRDMQVSGLRLIHGGWRDPLEEYLVPSDAYFEALDGTFFASGHLHVQYVWKGGQVTYCNPGAVGQPRDGDARAAFATWDGTEFSLHRVPYDVDRTAAAMQAAGFSEYYYENLYAGARIGGTLSRRPVD
ncbi:metallophosphoesterase family protein [Cupriavidus pauculus]|uniref:metallophosphoesterase family protein n=1 Tax=Cupriavidus pauculus TaxID=82633 RepID=UPI000782F17F|nr:metallophosphoesterase family protein [Cupriavidus pauculus]MBY4731296.1 metallophosphatase family protein [Cupriavidus pauculus]